MTSTILWETVIPAIICSCLLVDQRTAVPIEKFLKSLRLHTKGSIQANHLPVDHGILGQWGHQMGVLCRITQARGKRHLACQEALHLLRQPGQQRGGEKTCIRRLWKVTMKSGLCWILCSGLPVVEWATNPELLIVFPQPPSNAPRRTCSRNTSSSSTAWILSLTLCPLIRIAVSARFCYVWKVLCKLLLILLILKGHAHAWLGFRKAYACNLPALYITSTKFNSPI